jgi:glutamine---fructose-6-phosphate transaminase (isomerizing)
MNNHDGKYTGYALCREMWETTDIIRNLPVGKILENKDKIREQVLLSGEGSSRIFPAKNLISVAARHAYGERLFTEGATQALEYDLKDKTVFVASNSGKTKEGVRLIRKLKAEGPTSLGGVVAAAGTPIADESDFSYILSCGKEEAVAATKSVMEQALYYDILFREKNGRPLPDLNRLADLVKEALALPVPGEIIGTLAASPILYWAGRNNGVAEELRLKTNEITRKKSDFLEGTYGAHGIEEVMQPGEAVILVSPFSQELEKFDQVLRQGVGVNLISLSTEETPFPTVKIPATDDPDLLPYVELAAGWNLLVETGLALNVNLDKPVRARKVGNEWTD